MVAALLATGGAAEAVSLAIVAPKGDGGEGTEGRVGDGRMLSEGEVLGDESCSVAVCAGADEDEASGDAMLCRLTPVLRSPKPSGLIGELASPVRL